MGALSRFAVLPALLVLSAGCGGDGAEPASSGDGSGGTVPTGGETGAAAPNTVAVIVDPGPPGAGYVNGLFATVTLCVPGTTSCQTFDHLLVDTGSVGVRVFASQLTLPLPAVMTASNQPLVECIPFVAGTVWGTVATADVKMGGESAANIPVQLIGDETYAVPTSCTGSSVTDQSTLGANGLLGVGVYAQDCGDACARAATSRGNPGIYYTCASSRSCAVASAPLAQQVVNPVAAFPVDNNGTIIKLPGIAASGAVTVPGTLTFGIGTEANNALGSATVLPIDDTGFVGTTFPIGGSTYTSYLDSGSNGLYFLDSGTANLAACAGDLDVFYCPAATASLEASIVGTSGATVTVPFSVANAANFANADNAFSDLGGPMPGFPTDPSAPGFDWGLPFFFGRSVYSAIEGLGTPAGPYFAF